MSREPWEIPIQYNDDRFEEEARDLSGLTEPDDGEPPVRGRSGKTIDEVMVNQTNDTTPLDYRKGDPNEVFGDVEDEYEAPDYGSDSY